MIKIVVKIIFSLLLLLSSYASCAQMVGTPKMLIKKQQGLPGNIVLGRVNTYFIPSIYDQDYLPYTASTVAATWDTAQGVDGNNEAFLIDLQGTLTTSGVTLRIPYIVSNSAVNISSYDQIITVPAALTQDGVSRNVMFSYPSQTLNVGSGGISATLKALGGTLNIKKLDMQTGTGNDNLGVLIAQFTYTIDASGNTNTFDFRSIAGIPDKNYADSAHRFFYLPVRDILFNWLNNNLGANYANVNQAVFNLAKQATGTSDKNAYGSLYQWGRYSDGHELINRLTGTAVNSTTTTLSNSFTPANGLYIGTGTAPNYWFNITINTDLWTTETNNPCPTGYQPPLRSSLARLSAQYPNLAAVYNSNLKIPAAGYRTPSASNILNTESNAFLMSSTLRLSGSIYEQTRLNFSASTRVFETTGIAGGGSVRCVENLQSEY